MQGAVRKIQESVTNYSSYNLANAKLAYIKAWQSLPDYGLTHYLVKFKRSRKEVRHFGLIFIGMFKRQLHHQRLLAWY